MVMFTTEGFISFNRATTILLTFRHNDFWKIGMIVAYASSAILPFLVFWDVWFEDVVISIDEVLERYTWTGSKEGIIGTHTTQFYSFIGLGALAIWNIVWNLYVLAYLVRRVIRASKNTTCVTCLVDTKQFLISFVTFLIESSTVIITIWLFTVSSTALDLACQPLMYFLIDMCQCLPAWLMVFMNVGIRNTLKEHCSEALSRRRMRIRLSKSHSLSVQTTLF